MSDSNYSYLEAAARRKKKNQVISIFIIIAVVLVGVAIWGVREHQRNEAAERIKNALNSQAEPPAFADDSASKSAMPETSKVVVQDTPATPVAPVQPPPKVEPVETPAPKQSPAVAKSSVKPVKSAKHKKHTVVAKENPAPEVTPPVAEPVAPAPVQAEVKPTPPPAPKPVEVAKVVPKPAAPTPVATPTPPPVAPQPVKAFAPEDAPMPQKAELSEESRLAVNTMPKAPEPAATDETTAMPPSDTFKQGLAAYRQNDFANAILLFAQLSKPTTKKRGDQTRDEYVQGNFMRGVSLMRAEHTSEAVTAFMNVLEYEKYYPLANMNLGICYVDLKQYAKAHKAFENVIRDQNYIDPAMFDDVMQRTKYFWALTWTRLFKNSSDPDKQAYYRQQAMLRWKDYLIWFGKNDKYRPENQKANDYLNSLSSL